MGARKSTLDGALRNWDQLRYALALARGATLSAAARRLGVDHTTVARRIDMFERELGALLFDRQPDGFALTTLGAAVLAAAERIEAEMQSLARRIDGADPKLTGTVRLTTTGHLAPRLFAPALAGFRRQHPGLDIELIGDNRSLDLSRREADLAVRMGRPDNVEIVARKLCEVAFACYAAAGDARSFEEQSFLGYDDAMANAGAQRYLTALVPPRRIVLRANAMLTLHEAARAGVGCAVLPCMDAEADPALRRVPAPRAMPPVELWLLYHEDLRRSPRLRAVVAWIDDVIRAKRGETVPAGFPFDPAG